MLTLLRWVMWLLSVPVFALRYRVTVRGLEEVQGLKKALILPNHPAFVDPPLVLRALWPTLKPRPMLAASAMANPMVAWIPPLLDAVKVPDLNQASAQAREQAQAAIEALAQSLEEGRNVILWPAGHLSHSGQEHLGSTRSLTEILQRVPDANIVLVRTQGLWGSRLSFAYTGRHPGMAKNMIKGIGWVLANLLLFMPRRKVTITVHKFDRSELPPLERDKVNRFFESWYNGSEPVKPVFVPYHFLLGPREHIFPPIALRQQIETRDLTPEAIALVHDAFHEKLQRDIPEHLRRPEVELDQLGLDSLDRMELTLLIEQRSGFTSQQVPTTLGDLYALAQGAADTGPPPVAPEAWHLDPVDRKIELLGETIPHALINRALASPKDIAAADDMSGALSYERFLVAAITLSKRFAQLASPNVAVMLPASVASDIVITALHMAGKLPVMINWTTGKANVAHALSVMQVTHVVSSQKFMDRIGVTLENAQFLHMEDLRKGIGKLELLTTLLKVRYAGRSVLDGLPRIAPSDPAAVLFTSGSEKAPKAVPLSHANILANLRAVISSFELTPADRLLGFLPPFHSFGLSVTSLFPILAGLRVVHHPDPTAAAALAGKIASFRPTIVCGTPTFVGYILNRAKPEDVSSIRMWVVGAEKCPPHIFEKVQKMTPDAHLLEGYGITECSPLISVNRIEKNKPGSIGLPLPGVEVRIVDHDTLEPVGTGQQGLILVHGDNVFSGYIGHDGPQPFLEHDGKRWYNTGDLGILDEQGFITFAGRLKRFLKAGGEMISLPAIEEPFVQAYPADDKGPRVAVEGIETEKGRRIVLFTREDITLPQANSMLAEHGMSGLMRLNAVKKVDQIPVLGTGKTDYKQLRAQIEAELAAPALAQ